MVIYPGAGMAVTGLLMAERTGIRLVIWLYVVGVHHRQNLERLAQLPRGHLDVFKDVLL